MKKFKKQILVAVAIVFVLCIAKDQLIKAAVTIGATAVVGAPVHIDGMSVGIFRQSVRIKGFKMYNPAGFPQGVMVDIPTVSVDYDLSAILKGDLHLPLLILDLKEMTIVKNKEGKLNVDALKVAQKKEDQKGGKFPASIPLRIDEATLNLGKVIVKDYTKGDESTIQAYDIGVRNKTYRNIKSAEQFATLVMIEAMGPTAFKNAAIYGAATVLGVAFLPAGVAGIMLAKDSSTQEFGADLHRVYDAILSVLKKQGNVQSENISAGAIKANVNGVGVSVSITRNGNGKTQVKISARKYFLPKPEIASGIMYQLSKIVK